MKAVLISIQPKWCELIASGKKTVEVRKTKPKLETPFRVYIYCTKSKNQFLQSRSNMFFYCESRDTLGGHGAGLYRRLNGKVIGEFVCDEINEYTNYSLDEQYGHINRRENLLRSACMTLKDWRDYIGSYRSDKGYAWHISSLVIYDKPKELREFTKAGTLNYDDWLYGIYNGTTESTYEKYLIPFKVTRPPQSWCYVERLGDAE